MMEETLFATYQGIRFLMSIMFIASMALQKA